MTRATHQAATPARPMRGPAHTINNQCTIIQPATVDEAPHLTRAHQISETPRIMRAAHAFGVLRLPLVPRRYLPGRVERQYENIRDRVLGEVAPEVSRRDAMAKLRSARDLLVDGDLQEREGSRLLASKNLTAPVIHHIRDCPIDIAALRRFAQTAEADKVPSNKHGASYGLSYRDMINNYLTHVRVVREGKGQRGSVSLTYRHRGIGAELVAAGVLVGARVYADESSADPFVALPKRLRHIALAKYGFDFDDEASHPRAAVRLTRVGRDHRLRFLAYRKTIFSEVSRALWPGDDPSMHRSAVKQLFNAKDMRGSTRAWCDKHGIPGTSAVLNIRVHLPGWSHLPLFTVRNYFEAVAASLDDIDCRWSETTALVSEWRQYWKPSDGDAEATTQSYLRQEAEAVSLLAKLHVAKCLASVGVHAVNLQHDGLPSWCAVAASHPSVCDASSLQSPPKPSSIPNRWR